MKKKEQHYVPKFFLRRFSVNENGKTISVFNIKRQLYIAESSIKSQACKPYFYGEDSRLEDALGDMEGISAGLLGGISDTLYIPAQGSADWLMLLAFILTSDLRTPTASGKLEYIGQALHDLTFEDATVLPTNADELKVKAKEAIQQSLMHLELAILNCADLHLAIIKNKSLSPFITCDNPVIKYNQYLEKRKAHGGTTGYGQIGLQIFFPIDAATCLFLYDPWVYKLKTKSPSIVEIDNEQDVKSINILNFINCDRVVYSNHLASKRYLETLHSQAARFERINTPDVKKYYAMGEKKGGVDFGPEKSEGDMMIHMYSPAPKTNLDLSFILQKKQAKRFNPPHSYKRKSCVGPDPAAPTAPFRFDYGNTPPR